MGAPPGRFALGRGVGAGCQAVPPTPAHSASPHSQDGTLPRSCIPFPQEEPPALCLRSWQPLLSVERAETLTHHCGGSAGRPMPGPPPQPHCPRLPPLELGALSPEPQKTSPLIFMEGVGHCPTPLFRRCHRGVQVPSVSLRPRRCTPRPWHQAVRRLIQVSPAPQIRYQDSSTHPWALSSDARILPNVPVCL